MLCYLDQPVPSNIQAYLQSFHSPHLSYATDVIKNNNYVQPLRDCGVSLKDKPNNIFPSKNMSPADYMAYDHPIRPHSAVLYQDMKPSLTEKQYPNSSLLPIQPTRSKSATFLRKRDKDCPVSENKTLKLSSRAKSASSLHESRKHCLKSQKNISRSSGDVSKKSFIPTPIRKTVSYSRRSPDQRASSGNCRNDFTDGHKRCLCPLCNDITACSRRRRDVSESSSDIIDAYSNLSLSSASSVFDDSLNFSTNSSRSYSMMRQANDYPKRSQSAPGFRESRKSRVSKIPQSVKNYRHQSDISFSNVSNLNNMKEPKKVQARPISAHYSAPLNVSKYDYRKTKEETPRHVLSSNVCHKDENGCSFSFNTYQFPECFDPSGTYTPKYANGYCYSDTVSTGSHPSDSQFEDDSVKDFDEILMMLQKPESTGKRDGLNSMLAFLHSLKSMTHDEVLHVKTIFNRYFAEQNSKVYSLFLDVLSEFIVQYKNDLQDWLFILLTRLLQRISVDALPSSQTKIARTLDVVRDSYPYDYQFQIITKYITDNTQTPTLKMKVSLLQYLLGLVALMDASDFANTGPIRLAVSKIITWISEPKSADVRKEATAVIVALFQLNTPEFSALLSNVPSSIQDGATRVIQLNIKQNVYGMPSPHPSDEVKSHQTYQTKRDERPTYSTPHQAKKRNEDGALHYRPASRQDSHDDMSPTSKIPIRQRPSLGGDEVFTSPVASSSSTSTSTPIRSKTPSYSNDHSGNWLTKDTSDYLPKKYEDLKINGTCSPSEFMKDSSAAVSEEDGQPSSVQLVNQVYVVLTSPDAVEESDDTKSALLELLKMIRSGDKQLNATKLTSFIPPLLNLLRHREATIRCLVARSLREMALMRADVFQSDLATFIVPLLQAEADPQKEVARTAEECCTILSQSLSPSVVISVVSPLVGSAEYPTNQSAIKMMHVIAENCEASLLRNYLDIIVPNLLKAYDHQESSVRKAAVFCLVSIHNRAGSDKVMPYFKTLAGSKMKLLNLYIRRSQSTTV